MVFLDTRFFPITHKWTSICVSLPDMTQLHLLLPHALDWHKLLHNHKCKWYIISLMHILSPHIVESHLNFHHLLVVFIATWIEIFQFSNIIGLELAEGNKPNLNLQVLNFKSYEKINMQLGLRWVFSKKKMGQIKSSWQWTIRYRNYLNNFITRGFEVILKLRNVK